MSQEVASNMDPIASQWQRLASMDRRSPDFLPLFSFLTTWANCSSTAKLRGDDAKITLGALDEVRCHWLSERVGEWLGIYPRCRLSGVVESQSNVNVMPSV